MDDPRKFDWNHIRAFLATAETGSLSAAARTSGPDPTDPQPPDRRA